MYQEDDVPKQKVRILKPQKILQKLEAFDTLYHNSSDQQGEDGEEIVKTEDRHLSFLDCSHLLEGATQHSWSDENIMATFLSMPTPHCACGAGDSTLSFQYRPFNRLEPDFIGRTEQKVLWQPQRARVTHGGADDGVSNSSSNMGAMLRSPGVHICGGGLGNIDGPTLSCAEACGRKRPYCALAGPSDQKDRPLSQNLSGGGALGNVGLPVNTALIEMLDGEWTIGGREAMRSSGCRPAEVNGRWVNLKDAFDAREAERRREDEAFFNILHASQNADSQAVEQHHREGASDLFR